MVQFADFGEIVFMQIPNHGQVACGRIVPFPTPVILETLPLPSGIGDPKDLMIRRACGDSLAPDGIYDGDVLICTRKFDAENIAPAKIYIVRLFGSEELAKHIGFAQDGKISLFGRVGGRVDYRIVEREDVEIVARVTFSLRCHG